MPTERLVQDAHQLLQERNHFTEGLIRLTRSYRVSIRAMARRLLELGIMGNVVIIRWDWMLKPNEPQDSMLKLRVDWAEPSTYPYIPRFKPASRGSIFERASYTTHVLREQRTPIQIGSLKGSYSVEALSYGESKRLSNLSNGHLAGAKPVLSIIWLGGE